MFGWSKALADQASRMKRAFAFSSSANGAVLATSRIRAESQLEFEIIGSFNGYSWSNSEIRLLSSSPKPGRATQTQTSPSPIL